MRKWIGAMALALALAAVASSVEFCDLFEPESYWWCWFKCSPCTAGGGGSGAGQP